MQQDWQHEWAKRQDVLERLFVGFQGTALPDELTSLLAAGLAGVAIYRRNYRNLEELLALTTSIRNATARPVLIGIDQEGGTKFSLPEPFTQWPSPAELGRLGDASLTERIAAAIARELSAADINLNFAPMLDLATNPASPVTMGRSFSADPGEVARLGTAFLRGLEAGGVLGSAKHFPGHGDAAMDPHLDLPRFDGTRGGLMQRELVPFAAAIRAGVSLMMTAHILLPKIDATLPASLSPKVLDGLLRQELKFEGVILADDLGMGAIARRYGPGESIVKTLEAGTDVAMLCHDWSAVASAGKSLADAISMERFDAARWAQSSARIVRLREHIGKIRRNAPPASVIGCAEHHKLAAEVRARLSQ